MNDPEIDCCSNDVFPETNDVVVSVVVSLANSSSSASLSLSRTGSSSSSSSSSSPSSSSSFYRRTMSSQSSNEQYNKRNSSSIHCRICHEDESLEEFVDPCKCAGSVGNVHASCLEKWLSTSNTDRCEICKYAFTIQRKKKSVSKSVIEWWRSKSAHGPRGVTGDAICLTILTPLCLAATYLCAVGATAYSRLGYWEGAGLTVLCSLLVATYLLWLIITIRYHYKIWRQWRRQNQEVVLLVKHKDDQPPVQDQQGLNHKSSSKSPFHRQDRNNNRNIPIGSASLNPSTYLIGRTFSHQEDPTYTVHQQTSFV